MKRLIAAAAAAVVALPGAPRADAWTAGGLTFSDELGGMRLISVSGSGSVLDPIVIVEELTGSGPAVLVVRGTQERPHQAQASKSRAYIDLAVIKIVINRSRRPWAGFELELQEVLRKPSTYEDGLSFDQIGRFGAAPSSDRFAAGRLVHEPHDRVRFADGIVDPGESVRFNFFITDPTPAPEFYLLQEPQVLMARRPSPTWLAGAPTGTTPRTGRSTAAPRRRR